MNHQTLTSSSVVRVRPSSRSAWTVSIDDEDLAIVTGMGCRDRAIDLALRQAEALRSDRGEVRVVIEPPPSARTKKAAVKRAA